VDAKGRVLIVDDEESMRRFFQLTLQREGYLVGTAESVKTAVSEIETKSYDLVLSDIRLGDGHGIEVLEASKVTDPDVPVIMMTAYASAETAVEAMKKGAVDYLSKPFNVDEVRIVVENNVRTRKLVRENRALKERLREATETRIIYRSALMDRILSQLKRVAKLDTTVMVVGESGTGKELVMRMIHDYSPRHSGPFVSVNCGALPGELFESELFGYEKGAFTGANRLKHGLIESAEGGTLFLDEIGEMPLQMQVKLLRVLQERTIRRVGGTKEIAVDVRVVAATNQNLEEQVEKGDFREDLYYRINVIPVELPSLRERPDDIAPLVRYFLKRTCRRFGEASKEMSPGAMAKLEHYRWPGNVRELENTIERLVALTPEQCIDVEHLPDKIRSEADSGLLSMPIYIPDDGFDLDQYLEDLRFKYLEAALKISEGVQSKSCELLGMSFRSFRYYYAKAKEKGQIED